ncbi:hypothetical protein AB1N83_010679, partial [Pleurotus pulmonarius]
RRTSTRSTRRRRRRTGRKTGRARRGSICGIAWTSLRRRSSWARMICGTVRSARSISRRRRSSICGARRISWWFISSGSAIAGC